MKMNIASLIARTTKVRFTHTQKYTCSEQGMPAIRFFTFAWYMAGQPTQEITRLEVETRK